MTTQIFDKIFDRIFDKNFTLNNIRNDRITNSNKLCKNCDDTYHPINLCYNYEPKFKQIIKPVSWSNYFKSYFVKLEPIVEIIKEPVYYKYNVKPFDSGKSYCSSDLTNSIGGITNFPFKTLQTKCDNREQLPSTKQEVKVNWLPLVKLNYLMNDVWVDITNYISNLYKNVYKLIKPVNYITETKFKDQINEMKQMKNTIENMKNQMLYDLKHKIKNEFIILNNSDNNYKVHVDNKIKEIKNKLESIEINLDEINIVNHKQKTKLLIEDIKNFNKDKLNKDMVDNANIKKLIDQFEDYQKIEI